VNWLCTLPGTNYLAITDHNQPVSSDSLLEHTHLTLIPGIEWTHYRGHANFLGVNQPYDEPFIANTLEEIQARFASARARGAFICINHPCDPVCPFLFDIASIPFDCWKCGTARCGSNLVIGWAHLMAGRSPSVW
jgi:predicted metal-dependent phosphoesterase TrpH